MKRRNYGEREKEREIINEEMGREERSAA